jgi:hypothetical protein
MGTRREGWKKVEEECEKRRRTGTVKGEEE